MDIILCLSFAVIILTVRLIGNRTHFRTIKEQLYAYQSKIALGFASFNYATVTSTIIPKLYSNACDYLYVMRCMVKIYKYEGE